MTRQILSMQLKNFRLACQEPECDFHSHNPGIVHLTDADFELLRSLISPIFVPTPEQAERLQEIIGDESMCPTHGRKNLGLIYEKVQTIFISL